MPTDQDKHKTKSDHPEHKHKDDAQEVKTEHSDVKIEEHHEHTENKSEESEVKDSKTEDYSELNDSSNSDTTNIANENIADNIKTEDTTDAVYVRKSSSTSRLFILALFIGLIVGLFIFGGYVFYDSGFNFIKPAATPTPTAMQPSPTEEPELNLSEYNVQVQNGTGESGAAGEVASLLEEAGFENIDTGNADNYDYTDTEVAMKGSVNKLVFDKIKEALSEFNVVQVTNLDDESEFDIVVVSGVSGSETSEEEVEPTDATEEEVETTN